MYIPCIDVGAMIQQESDNLDTLKGHGFVQRRLFARILCIDVGAVCQKTLDLADVASTDCAKHL